MQEDTKQALEQLNREFPGLADAESLTALLKESSSVKKKKRDNVIGGTILGAGALLASAAFVLQFFLHIDPVDGQGLCVFGPFLLDVLIVTVAFTTDSTILGYIVLWCYKKVEAFLEGRTGD